MLKCTLKFTVNQKCGNVSLDNPQPSVYVRVMCIFFLAAASQTTLVTTARDTETSIAVSTRPTVRTRTTSQLDLNIAVTHLKSYTSTNNRFIHLFVLQKWQWILVIQKKTPFLCSHINPVLYLPLLRNLFFYKNAWQNFELKFPYISQRFYVVQLKSIKM